LEKGGVPEYIINKIMAAAKRSTEAPE